MEPERRYAYRMLLAWVVAEIRNLTSERASYLSLLNPFFHFRLQGRLTRARLLAEWVHNLATFSTWDFEHFDEARFWGEAPLPNEPSRSIDLTPYRHIFDRGLKEFRAKAGNSQN